jgi:hypothetical protein
LATVIAFPSRAKGTSSRGKTAVAALRRIAQRERADLETAAATGIVREPRIGTKTVRRVIVSTFIWRAKYIYAFFNCQAFSTINPQNFNRVFQRQKYHLISASKLA